MPKDCNRERFHFSLRRHHYIDPSSGLAQSRGIASNGTNARLRVRYQSSRPHTQAGTRTLLMARSFRDISHAPNTFRVASKGETSLPPTTDRPIVRFRFLVRFCAMRITRKTQRYVAEVISDGDFETRGYFLSSLTEKKKRRGFSIY